MYSAYYKWYTLVSMRCFLISNWLLNKICFYSLKFCKLLKRLTFSWPVDLEVSSNELRWWCHRLKSSLPISFCNSRVRCKKINWGWSKISGWLVGFYNIKQVLRIQLLWLHLYAIIKSLTPIILFSTTHWVEFLKFRKSLPSITIIIITLMEDYEWSLILLVLDICRSFWQRNKWHAPL